MNILWKKSNVPQNTSAEVSIFKHSGFTGHYVEKSTKRYAMLLLVNPDYF